MSSQRVALLVLDGPSAESSIAPGGTATVAQAAFQMTRALINSELAQAATGGGWISTLGCGIMSVAIERAVFLVGAKGLDRETGDLSCEPRRRWPRKKRQKQ
jgi:hypothetical protein